MPSERIEEHNSYQRWYFGQRIKPTMVPGRTPYILRHVREALSAGGLGPGSRVLEVGCGMGRHAFIMADMGLRVEGIELSPFLIEQFRRFDGGRYDIPVHQADIHSLPQQLHSRFDAVVGFFVLHHILDLPLAFAQMARALVPGGRVVFVEPNPYNPLFYLQIFLTPGMSWRAERGIAGLTKGALRRASEAAGLEGLWVRKFGLFPPHLANRRWGARLQEVLERWSRWGPAWAFQLIRAERPQC